VMPSKMRNIWFFSLFFSALALAAPAAGAQSQPAEKPAATEEQDPLKRPLTEKQKKEQEKRLKRELADTYKHWLNEDVSWIIMDEELQAFKQLSNDDERDQFIEQFWLRRDPTPDTIENEYKEEHYRRIAYANERFAAGIPGWRTDRGRIYIIFGPADQITGNPAGGMYHRPPEEGGGTTSTFPFEIWRYRYLEGIGQEIEIEFVDKCMCGAFEMTMDRSEKDALLHTPQGGMTWMEEMGLANKADRWQNYEKLGNSPFNRGQNTRIFDRLELYGKLSRPPAIKFKDLEEVVHSKIRYNLMPFDVRVDFVKVTADTVLVPITIQVKNRDMTFNNKDGVARGVVNIFGRVTTMTGRIAQTFEDTVQVDVPEALLEKSIEKASVYWKALPLRPNRYRIDIVVKDVNGDKVGTWQRGVLVPEFQEDQLAHSTLILADDMRKVAKNEVGGTGNFVIGDTRVRPRVDSADGKPASFKRDQRLNLWMQVYGLQVDEAKKRPSATIEYQIVNSATQQAVVQSTESTDQMGNIADQVTLEKSVALASLPPGAYLLTIKVNDHVSKQQIAPTAKFVVE
jgi:GWxTD domain-containing protein